MSLGAPLRRLPLYGGITAAGIYLFVCGAMYLAQDSMVFHPTRETEATIERVLATPGAVALEVEHDDVTLFGALIPGAGEEPRPTIFYFGGNGERVWRRAEQLEWVRERGFNVAFASYRGYDRSTGSPSGPALPGDAVAVYDAIVAHPAVDPTRVITWGYSLGSGVAVSVAGERPVAGVVLVAPYDELSAIGAAAYPWLPVRALFKHEISSTSHAPGIEAPLLIVHGEDDTLIPPEHSAVLAAAWAGPVTRRLLNGAGHGGVWNHPLLDSIIRSFITEIASSS